MISNASLETLARTIHEDYVRRVRYRDAYGDCDASLLPWDSLPESLRRSNRDQAVFIEKKLQAIGCEALASSSVQVPAFEFRDDELELLARMEHVRWIEERERDGWTLGSERDSVKKRTPYLVPWEELSEEIRDLDRETVSRIPSFLAEVGLQVVRRA